MPHINFRDQLVEGGKRRRKKKLRFSAPCSGVCSFPPKSHATMLPPDPLLLCTFFWHRLKSSSATIEQSFPGQTKSNHGVSSTVLKAFFACCYSIMPPPPPAAAPAALTIRVVTSVKAIRHTAVTLNSSAPIRHPIPRLLSREDAIDGRSYDIILFPD